MGALLSLRRGCLKCRRINHEIACVDVFCATLMAYLAFLGPTIYIPCCTARHRRRRRRRGAEGRVIVVCNQRNVIQCNSFWKT